jgi:pimeloyl-ACP methyl ester carboxylesterase
MQREMALRGHRTLAVDLPGRGAGFSLAYQTQDLAAFAAEPSPLADVTGPETVGHVVDVVRRVREHGPVILVGHSQGGLTITGVGNEIPELLHRIVYIAAQCPSGATAIEYLTRPEWGTSELFPATAPIIMGDPAELGYIRLNWRTTDREVLGRLQSALGVPDEQKFVELLARMQPDEVFWQNDPSFDYRVDKDAWERLPHSFIRLTEDRSMPLAAQDMYIAEADALTPDNPFDVHSAPGGHGTFLRSPKEVAGILSTMAYWSAASSGMAAGRGSGAALSARNACSR